MGNWWAKAHPTDLGDQSLISKDGEIYCGKDDEAGEAGNSDKK